MTGLNKSCFKDLKTSSAPIIVVFASLENFFAVYPTPLMTKALKEVKYKKQKGVKHKAKKRHVWCKFTDKSAFFLVKTQTNKKEIMF